MGRTVRVALALFVLATAPAKAEPVDLMLVLAADVSRSIDQPKYQLQREGYAAAMANPRVIEAISSGINGRIAVCFVEWSGADAQKVVVDWLTVGDVKSAHAFGTKLLETPRSFADRTSISAGIDFAAAQFARSPHQAKRKTIDISGDGTNNAGRDVTLARDEALAQGITINGIVILSDRPLPWNPEHTNPPGGLSHYYKTQVIGGPGAFVMEAKDFQSFGQSLVNKLVAEISGAPASTQNAAFIPR